MVHSVWVLVLFFFFFLNCETRRTGWPNMGRENPHFSRMNVYAAADFSCPFFPLSAWLRCGEEEKPSMWLCDPTGWLGGRCASKARSEWMNDVGVAYLSSSLEKKNILSVSLASCQQAIILEGSYWKRRIEVVIKEYHKWRIYYKKRVSAHLIHSTSLNCL